MHSLAGLLIFALVDDHFVLLFFGMHLLEILSGVFSDLVPKDLDDNQMAQVKLSKPPNDQTFTLSIWKSVLFTP